MISFERQGWEDYLYWQETDKIKGSVAGVLVLQIFVS